MKRYELFTRLQALVLILQLLRRLCDFGVNEDATHRTNLLALRLIVMADTFGAFGWIDDVDFRSKEDRLVRALRHTYIAIDAIRRNE